MTRRELITLLGGAAATWPLAMLLIGQFVLGFGVGIDFPVSSAYAKATFFMGLWYATVTFALLVDRQMAEAFRPVRFKWVPIKSKLIQLLSAWCR